MHEQAQQEQKDKTDEAANVFCNIEDKLDTAQLYQRAGDLPRAEELYREILQEDPSNPDAHHLMGLIALQVGKPEIAKQFIQTAIALKDNDSRFHANLGAAYYSLQQFDEAAEAYHKATEIDPRYGEAYLNWGIVLKEQKKYEAAVQPLDHAISIRQDDPRGFALLAEVLIKLDRFQEADTIVQAAIKLKSSDCLSLYSIAQALIGLGRPKEVIDIAQELLNSEPTNSDYYILMTKACLECGLWEEAIKNARRALYINSNNLEGYKALSQALTLSGQWDEALSIMIHCSEKYPENEEFVAHKAHILEKKGRIKEAYMLVRPYIKNKKTYKLSTISTFSTIAKRFGKYKEAVDFLELIRRQRGLPQGAKCSVNFQIGGVYHDLGKYDDAFEAFKKGNELKPREYDAENTENFFNKLKNSFSKEYFLSTRFSELSNNRPVFVVGMPRSGTSLIEQILASHPEVFGAGELDTIGTICRNIPIRIGSSMSYPECAAELTTDVVEKSAQEYLDRLNELAPEDRSRVTDKMPQNFLHLGIMAMMFPNATFIHCRRDPIDTCLSCYFQNFADKGLSFAYKLENLGHYYLLYSDLMEHWKKVLPVTIHEIQYERLVENPSDEISSLLECCGLAWTDACLNFHKTERDTRTASYSQVRQPIYKSSKKKWKKYEKHLEPLKQALGHIER